MEKRGLPSETEAQVSSPKYYGKFYSAKPSKGKLVGCRSVLEICLKGRSLAELKDRQPDLYVVMMNPGGSYPVRYDKKEWFKHPRFRNKRFVEAVPDATQEQIVRVMEKIGPKFNHARVLNLTSYCQAKSKDLWGHGGKFLEKQSAFRAGQKPVIPEAAKVLFAWGVNQKLRLLKKNVDFRGFGVLKTGTTDCYRHPLPRNKRDQEKWVKLAVRSVNHRNNVCWSTGDFINV